MGSLRTVFVLIFLYNVVNAALDLKPANPAFDPKLYEDALDPELCAKQLDYISKNILLRLKFIDNGMRLPKAILAGNVADFGSYHDCLAINEIADGSVIDGKYCMLNVPIDQTIQIPNKKVLPDWLKVFPNLTNFPNIESLLEIESNRQTANLLHDGHLPDNINADELNVKINLLLGMCLPKACTTKQAIDGLYPDVPAVGLKHSDSFCRLPDDKPWAPADTVATTLLSVLGLVTICSTSYDIFCNVIMKEEPKKASTATTLLCAFSVFTNTRKVLTFKSFPGAVECIDGIRAFAMAWVILGHTFSSISAGAIISNMAEAVTWSNSVNALWLMSAQITVDTFFALSGILVVYTNAGKTTGLNFLKNLHLFYLNRFLRLFPVLALGVVLQVSAFHRIADGPYWTHVASAVEDCRVYWWTTLLHVQNYVNPFNKCLTHSWYVTVDFQLHIISPLVLFWVFTGKKKYAWGSLAAGVIVSITAASIYIVLNEFPSARPQNPVVAQDFMKGYYLNTLTRAPPFFVGMVFGYILFLYKKEKVNINKYLVGLIWLFTAASGGLVIYSCLYSNTQAGNNQTIETLINIINRPLWAACIGWMIFACMHGYGGIVNWILSMNEIKLIGRVSYAMYIIHYPMMLTYAGAFVAPIHFNLASWIYLFFGHFAVSFIVGLVMTILVDFPAAVLIKQFLGGPKKSQPPAAVKVAVVENAPKEEKDS